MRLEEQIYFDSGDLENLSASVMYSFSGPINPSQPLRINISRVSPISIPGFSPRTDYLEDYRKQQEETRNFMKEFEKQRKEEEEKKKKEELKLINPLIGHKSKPLQEMKYVEESFRLDSHEPFGDHLNYEICMKKIGSKSGRTLNLLNIHIPLGDDEDE